MNKFASKRVRVFKFNMGHLRKPNLERMEQLISSKAHGRIKDFKLNIFWTTDPVPRFTGKTGITGKTTEIPKNNREILICPSPIKKAIIDY